MSRLALILSILVPLALLIAIIGGFFVYAPVRSFNALMPKDPASARVAADVPYGEGPRRKLDIYAPRQKRPEARPVILFFYGGSWANGSREGYGFAGRALAAAGFVTIIPDYRLVPQVYFPDFLKDCADAVRWTRANVRRYGGDPDRIVFVGHSAGAYNAAMLALDPQWLGADRAAVRGFAGLAGPYDFLPLDGPVPIRTFGRWPDPDATQPIHFANASSPPTLLLHGRLDDVVRPLNSINLQRKLAAAGRDSRLILYPELGHVGIATALARPFRYRAPILDEVTKFAHRVADE